MLSDRDFIRQSLNTNLFFLRIMKEHTYFIYISLPEKYSVLKQEMKTFIDTFNNLLVRTIRLSSNVVGLKNDMLTEYTINAERLSELFTGAPIDRNTTRLEMQLGYNNQNQLNQTQVQNVYKLNSQILEVVRRLILYKGIFSSDISECRVFSTMYTSLIDHLSDEDQYYANILIKLQDKTDPSTNIEDAREVAFWNELMSEHAKFIRGLLDPSNETLIEAAHTFAGKFNELSERALEVALGDIIIGEFGDESLETAISFRKFIIELIQEVLECEVNFISVPLLIDHFLREANHYINFLQMYKYRV